jgi:flagellar motility protein MotE (MotC chaperone)
MSMLKESVIAEVKTYIEVGDHYCLDDFVISTPDNSSLLLEVKFRPFPSYSFKLTEEKPERVHSILDMHLPRFDDDTYIIKTIEVPGDYKTQESHAHKNISEAITRILKWTDNVREGLVSKRNLSSLSSEEEGDIVEDLYNNIDDNIKDPEAYFTSEETLQLETKLDRIEERLSELESKFSIREEQSEEVKRVITQGKADLKLYPKGVWYKTAGTKISKCLKAILDTPEKRKELVDLVKLIFSGS